MSEISTQAVLSELKLLQEAVAGLAAQRTCPDPDMLWGKEEIQMFTGFKSATVNGIVKRKDFPRKAAHVLHRWPGRAVIKYFNER